MKSGSVAIGEGLTKVVRVSKEEAMRIAFAQLVAWAGGRDVTAPGHARRFHLLPGSGLPEFLEKHGMQMALIGVTDQPDGNGFMRFEVWEATGTIPLHVIEGAAEGLKRAAR